MPLVTPKTSAPPVEKPHEPVISNPQYRGVTVDTRYIPNASLLSHVEGSSWTVNFYSQVLASDSALSGQNVTMNPIHQQYRLVKGMELKVSSSLNTSQDPVTKSLIIQGAANVYPFIIPNEGDMFLADVGDGREGVFKITAVERKSVFKETIHAIEYILIDYSTDERRGDLNSKVVQTLQFIRDFMNYGQNPLLEEEDYAVLTELQGRYLEIAARYFRAFTSNEYKTLIIPGQDFPVYDHFLVNATMSFFTTYDAPEIRTVRRLNVDGDDLLKSVTIWDVIKNRDISMLKYCNRKAGLVSSRTFERDPMLEGIYHSGIRYVVYPKDPELLVDYQLRPREKPLALEDLKDSSSQVRQLSDLIGDTAFEGLTLPDAPPIHKVLVDDYYVFSQDFYEDNNPGQSLLEICVRDYLTGKALNNKALLALCQTHQAWGGLERFYYLPILLILIRASIRSI